MGRRVGVVAALVTLLGSGVAAARERAERVERAEEVREEGPKNVLSVAPAGLATGLVALEYERVVSDGLSLTFAPDLRVFRAPDGGRGGGPFADGERLLGLAGGLRWFMLGKAPAGLWLSPEVGTVLMLSRKDGQTTQDWAVPRFAATLGVTGVVGGWLSLSAGAGLQVISLVPMPNLRLSMGVAF